ncbi:MAG: hypothetical protein FD174_1501 [Geobacteraceae bacterium]|nr:MAG: hypothetical protein FD174_1501 [Geobacteraceae bacterium]
MKRVPFREVRVLFGILLLLVMPAIVHAQAEQTKQGPPPVATQLVREGDFAVKLAAALGLGTTEDEIEAETKLGEVGIAPRNGWIADYPVTPDVIGELQKSVGDAADAKKIAMSKEEALKLFENVSAEFSVAVKPHTVVKTYETLPEDAEKYPSPTVINNYYSTEGPPVVTYYAPPPDYYYLYSWVPYPFWWYGFWFPGFFILSDFHRPVFVSHRTVFISNHFNDVRVHRVFRVDPVRRFRGRTFAGIGVSDRRGFISTGVPRSERSIFNGPRTRGGPGSRIDTPPLRGGGRIGTPPARGGGRISTPPARGGSMGTPPARGGGRGGGPSSRGGGGFSGRGERR